jgi:hypothetical protein
MTNLSSITGIVRDEGHVSRILLEHTQSEIQAMDIPDQVLDMASEAVGSPRFCFENSSIYDISSNQHTMNLLVCCEVLELLDVPERGLEYLAAVATPYALLVYRGNHCGGP